MLIQEKIKESVAKIVVGRTDSNYLPVVIEVKGKEEGWKNKEER